MTDTKDRILDAAGALFRRQGYWGTGLKQIAQEAKAPWGSLYHFFPGGKDELTAETIRRSGERYCKLIAEGLARAATPLDGAQAMFIYMADILEASNFADGCPISPVAHDVAASSEPIRQACDGVFRSWQAAFAEWLRGKGVVEDEAVSLSCFVFAALEGAILLARTARSRKPLEDAMRYLAAVMPDSN